ncbi:MAG: histidine phosphatase family protein [Chitinophagaceae bacterium]|nr:histidine phosphatase family protein [Oligoflexus sp.]
MRRLILMRHGDAHSSPPIGLGDHGRRLTKLGLGAAMRLGQELRARGLSPDLILSSDASRATETLNEVVRGGGFTGVSIKTLGILYLAEPEALLDRCLEVEDTVQTLLLIGHNPGWSVAATQLSGHPVGLDTAQAALLEKSGGSWTEAIHSDGLWRLKGIFP